VNKADRDGAEGVVRELRSMIGLGSQAQAAWTPEIVTTTATTGQGLADLVLAISKHHDWALASGDRALRSVERAKLNLRRAVLDLITELMDVNAASLKSLSAQVANGEISTESAVKQILRDLS
jgi:LAO/AO transport system kinase